MFSTPSHGGAESFQGGNDSYMSMSPTSPVASLNTFQSPSSPFLPGYLLGDQNSQLYSTSSPRTWSSLGTHSPSQKVGQSASMMALSGPGSLRKDLAKGKIGGPPVKSLYGSPSAPDISYVGTPEQNRTRSSPTSRQTSGPPTTGLFQTPGGSKSDTSLSLLGQKQSLPISPTQVDPFYTQEDLKSSDVLDETWVTVFGFPPGAASFILQQFAQYGTVLKHEIPSECNWMHIHYMSKLQAKKALSKDGKVFGGCLKIGVTPCIEKIADSTSPRLKEDKENTFTNSTLDTSLRSSSKLDQSNLTPIRPLTAAYAASRAEYEILRDKPTPKRDEGLMSKLKEYMFGY